MIEKIQELENIINNAINEKYSEIKKIYELRALDIIKEIRGSFNGENIE